MHRIILLFVFASVLPVIVHAQQRLTAASSPTAQTFTGKFHYGNSNEPARAIEFEERTVTVSAFVANINSYFNIPADFTFGEAESSTDQLGMRHTQLRQYYKGIPIEGMAYRVHEKNGFVTSANGRAVRNIVLEQSAPMSEEQAFQFALKHIQTKDTTRREGTRIIVSKNFTFTPESFSIAYQFDIDVSLIERWRVSIDARDGQLINKVSLVNSCVKESRPPLPYETGTGITNYYGKKTVRVERLGDGSKLVGKTESGVTLGTYDYKNASVLALFFGFYDHFYEFYSADNSYDEPYDKPAISVQWGVEQAHEYYLKKHNRNSFDNSGAAIKSYVHVDRGLDNAFWTGEVLAFGDGSNNNALVELDIVSHELTHGVTQYEANLQYSYESGALNESFSDIFGKTVEFYIFGDSATWQLGKHFRDGGMRDLSNPNLKNQPDTYAGDMWYTGYEDGGGVHTNSGVQNFWFYLLCEGGSGINDHHTSYSVTAIGMEPASNIAYRNLTEYLSPYSDYLDSRLGSLLATADLYGKDSNIYQEVDKAWDAVGVIDEPIIKKLEFYDITATTVRIKGSLLPRGDTVDYYFEYGTTPDLGSSTSSIAYTNVVEGMLTELQSQTRYYLRLVATNENGRSYGAISEFTTLSLAPLVEIKQTVDVTETTAAVYGRVNPNSLFTSFHFEYGPTSSLGFKTAIFPVSDTTEFIPVTAALTNLEPRQTYYYKLVATNDFASSTSPLNTFFTATRPVITSYAPVTAPVGTEVVVTGRNFHQLKENSIVSFGATRAEVLSSSTTEVRVKVPPGASLGPITLLDVESGLVATSAKEFVPTYTGEFKKNDLYLAVGIADMYIWQALVEDMDGDQKPDIVARHYQGVSVFQNVVQGSEITIESFVRNTFPSESSISTISLVDFDGNGLKDVVGYYGNNLRIYPNYSVPGFIYLGVPVDVPLPQTGQFTFNDFDSDGHIDIAASQQRDGKRVIIILRNQNPVGVISADNFEERYILSLPYYPDNWYSEDLNNDDRPDLFAAIDSKGFVAVLVNRGQPGVFKFEEVLVNDSARGRFAEYVAQDLNQDGWKDLVSSSPHIAGNLSVLQNEGASPDLLMGNAIVTFRETIQSDVELADIDGDGKVDLIACLSNRRFTFLRNKTADGEPLSEVSFENFAEYGMALTNTNSGTVDARIAINDLNADGRPEIINAYSYNFGPHDGYQMEIWQNSTPLCPDPSLITVDISNTTATIVLPPDTNMDQFEIEYRYSWADYWYRIHSQTVRMSTGYGYQLRARARCYAEFTEYHYIDFAPECVDLNSFYIGQVATDHAFIYASNLNSFEVEYSPAGKEQWVRVPDDNNQLTNLTPGTTYDVRFRGECSSPTVFSYTQFTTLCPKPELSLKELTYDKAVVGWSAQYGRSVTLEYSIDNSLWTAMDNAGTIHPLINGIEYFIRGRLECTDKGSDFKTLSFYSHCPRVSNLSVAAVTPFSARINWAGLSPDVPYTVTFNSTVGGPATTIATNSTWFDLNDLDPGTRYKVGVVQLCRGKSELTTIEFNTLCYAPHNLSVNAVTHTTAELSWSDNFGGVYYGVDYSISGSNVWRSLQAANTHILLEKLRPGTAYEVRVRLNCTSETPPYDSDFFVTDLYEETSFSPNPTNNKITISPSKDLIGSRFVIYDNAGMRIAHGELLDYTIDFSNFSHGIYTLKIDGERTMRIVKY